MKAVILVGGLGTRLRPFTFSIPKPLLPIGERPILQMIIEHLKKFRIDDIILATGYQSELIYTFCGDGSRFGINAIYVHEDKPLGTAGPLSLLRDHFKENELFILMNGDIVTKLDFNRLINFSRNNDFDLTIGYTTYTYQSPFGVLSIDGDKVKNILEKPSVEYAISAGIYAIKSAVLKFIPDNTFFTMPQLAQQLISVRKNVGAYHIKELWIGLENVNHFDEALQELNNVLTEDITAD